MNLSKDRDLDLSPWGEIIYNAKAIAKKHSIEIIAFNIADRSIKAVFCGTKSKVKLFINDFRLGFSDYLKRKFSRDFASTLSDIYLLREISEESPTLIKTIRNEIFVRNISKHLNATSYLFMSC